MESQAIVIRILGSQRGKLIVLDKINGMIELIITKLHYIHIGYQIEYELSNVKGSTTNLNYYKITQTPDNLITKNIFFFHHLFELFYYFVPIGSCTEYLFVFLEELYKYNIIHTLLSDDHKRYFLIKFFYLLGIHYEEQEDATLERLLSTIASIPIDRFHNKNLDLSERIKIDFWLQLCIDSHPANKLFVTKNIFLKN